MSWPVLPLGLLGSQAATGDNDTYQISRSLRFNSGDSAYLSRTPSVAGNQKTWTWSGWVKKANSGLATFISADPNSGNRATSFFTRSLTDGRLEFEYFDGTTYSLTAADLLRDPSSYYHLVVAVDTTQVTNTNRTKIYKNGVLLTLSGTYVLQDTDMDINNNVRHNLGRYQSANAGATNYLDGYLAEVNFIDGQALTPSSFGETDAITGRWKAKAYSGTYGTNGFYLKFADNSSTAALGTDSSGNDNTWTTNNFSVTSGVDNDSLVDSPTNYGSDTGAGGEVRGNYCTLNPLSQIGGSFFQGNLRYTGPTNWRRANSTISVSTGKWYYEVTLGNAPFLPRYSGSAYNAFGFGVATSFNSSTVPGSITDGVILSDSGYYKNFSGSNTDGGTAFSSGDVLSIAVDLDANTYTFRRNNTQIATGTIGGTAGRELTPIIISYNGSYGVMNCNFGQRPFFYTAPSGFKCLCTTNLPTPTIKKPSSYMDVVTYTGNNASRSITGLNFSPDLVWIKSRSASTWNFLFDAVRGATKWLASNQTGAEATNTTSLTSFDSSGFSLSTDPAPDTSTGWNANAATYVAWAWDESPIAGMDIVSYVGDGNSGRAIPHGLGVAPKMVIVKNRTTSSDWPVYHSSLTANNIVFLHLTQGQSAISGLAWGGVSAVSNTTFTVTAGNVDIRNVNKAGDNHIAYCFAEVEGFSKFGSYTGNGSADGPFVYCGFRPRYIMYKRTDAVGNWNIIDTARDTYNPEQTLLRANLGLGDESNAVYTQDFLANGWKIRSTNVDINVSTATYIFAAFAESPFKYARAR